MMNSATDDPIGVIDLNRHGLIEASAGTGKTYAIENLVVRLLKEEPNVGLENILLVTFTEKAASELKIRIREKIEASLCDPGLDLATRKKLQLSVDEFDKAAIYTIHGFCHGVLRDFAFENGAPFRSEVIADPPLYEALLKEQMRKDWPAIYGDSLEEVLDLSRFSERKGEFLKTVTGLAASFHPEAGDRLIPDLRDRDFHSLKDETAADCTAIKAMIEPGLPARYDQLNFNKASRTTILNKMVVRLTDFFSAFRETAFDVAELARLMDDLDAVKSAGRKGLECLIPEKWNKGGSNLDDKCPELPLLQKALKKINEAMKVLRCHLTATSVGRLQEAMALAKEARGWISYHDMLALVDRAIAGDRSEALLKGLRVRFKAAFIDEFQDTDPIQWRIFRRIFIESPEPYRNRLFLIGDPKQAIYAFRGADVYAYLTARNEMEGLSKKEAGGIYSLRVNWRSVPSLIALFNHLFGREKWFKPAVSPGSYEIGYTPSQAPDECAARLVRDRSGRAVLNIMDLSDSPSPRAAKLHMARFVVQEILRLMDADIRIEEKGMGMRRLDLGDVAVLVRARSEAPLLEDELKKQGVPYTYYKKPGLFASDEAGYLSLVFHAILDPADGSAVKKALLTPFFGQRVQDLHAYEETHPNHPVKAILLKWNGFAVNRRWGHLFQSLMEDSGLLTRETGSAGWDRSYANYRQIFEYLKEAAYRKNLDVRGLSGLLDLLRNPAWEVEEGVDIHQIETESGKVQIMTMHVSKGLQFPVVFVAGGLTQQASNRDAYHVYHNLSDGQGPSGMARVFDLLKSGGNGRYEQEKTDEDKRLYYVAATRARFKLYLPFYLYDKGEPAWLGPVCTLLSPALKEAFPKHENRSDALWLKVGKPVGGSATVGDRAPDGHESGPYGVVRLEDLLIPESYADRQMRVESFSSLHEALKRAGDADRERPLFYPGLDEKEADEPGEPRETLSPRERTLPETLPGGTEVGLMFHEILERMDYNVALGRGTREGDAWRGLLDDPETREVIVRGMGAHGVSEQWTEAVSRILWNVLTAVIPQLEGGFALASLKPEDRLHEAAFYYPVLKASQGLGQPIGETRPNRFVRGYIDLIFRNNGRYYVADWKSNVLETGYDRASLAGSMADAGYHLQYKLYTVAALRWLRQVLGPRFDPARYWGGVFYFYLRGMRGTTGEGIWFVSPEELGDLEQLEQEIHPMLDARRGDTEFLL